MPISDWIAQTLFPSTIRRQVRQALAAEPDAAFTLGARSLWNQEQDRPDHDRRQVFEQALEAWRINPLARRIVGLTSQYVVGGGITFRCKDPASHRFLERFWNHPLNQLPVRIYEWCDELTRTGNLFLLLSTDLSGMSYLRAVPATELDRIEHLPNDHQQEVAYHPRPTLEDPEPVPWAAWQEGTDPRSADGGYPPVMLHFAINRPAGACWGESDLAPLLRWLSRYAAWLEDRARLNRYRNAFLFVLKARFTSEAERLRRQTTLNAAPPAPGSILVTDESEQWDVISPKLESAAAGEDGLALKKMIAAGAGIPLHFLAEPESSTRTTAEAAGGPTFRHFEQRQRQFLWLIESVLHAALQRRTLVDRRISRRAAVEVVGGDISARDNVALAMAASSIQGVLESLRSRCLIDDAELLRLAYRFFGETLDVEEMLARGAAAPPAPGTQNQSPAPNLRKAGLDPQTGEPYPGK